MPRAPQRALAAWLVAACAVAGLHCASQPYATGATADAEYDFSQVASFAFAKVPQKAKDSENGKILRAAIGESLLARGFREAPEGDADIWVSYDVGVFTASAVSWSQQQGPGQGRIIVRALDPATGREVWYGWAEANLRRQPDPERRIRAAVEALFQSRVRSR